MQVSDEDWMALSAYADGELGPFAAAALAGRLAQGSALAEALQKIRGLQRGLASLHAPAPLHAAAPAPRKSFRHRYAVSTLAASLLLAIGLAVAVVSWLKRSEDRVIAQALEPRAESPERTAA